jgi:hypothetical protein
MKKAYFCIDGFSFKRINDFYKYEHKRRSRLNIAALESYLRYEIARRFDFPSDSESISFEKHFYHPSQNPRSGFYKNSINDAIFKFESSLLSANYAVHYSQRASILEPKPNENLFTDLVVATQLKKIDIFILLSTQGQHVNILRQMKHCHIPSILIGWNASCKNSSGEDSRWKTDRVLCEFASTYCPLERILNMPDGEHPLVDIMFERFFDYRPRTCFSIF